MATNPPAIPKFTRPGTVPKATAMNCPNCGNAMQLRAFANAVNVVCPSCGSILDVSDPRLQVLQKAASKERVEPLLPLGARGRWKGRQYETIGFQRRTIVVDGISYHWF